MTFLLLCTLIAGVVWLRRNPDTFTTVVSTARAAAIHVNLAKPDYGTLQQQVLLGAKRRRCVAVNGVVRVPREYLVTFDEIDRPLVEPVADAFFADITEVLVADAEAKSWQVDGVPIFRAAFADHGRVGFPQVEAIAAASRRLVPAQDRGDQKTCAPDAFPTEGPVVVKTRVRALRQLGSARSIELGDDVEQLAVGRGSSCHVLLDHPAISARHATMSRGGAGWMIVDAGSRNGTFVNDRAAATRTLVDVGDVVRFGPDMAFVAED